MGKAVEVTDEELLTDTKHTFGYAVIVILTCGFIMKIVMSDFATAFADVLFTVIGVLCYWWVVGKHEEYLKTMNGLKNQGHHS